MILVGDTVIVDVVETGNAEDDYYCGMYNGKYGNVTAKMQNDVCEVQVDGVERPCYFYEYELTKRQRPAKGKKGAKR